MLSNLYQSFLLSQEIKLFFICIVFLTGAYIAGTFLWPLQTSNRYLLLANRIFFGVLFFIWCIAVYTTRGHTLLLPFAIVFGFGLYNNLRAPFKQQIQVSFLFKWLLSFIAIWIANYFIFNPVKQNSLVIVNDDLALYSDFANYIFTTGNEALQQFYYVHPIHNSLYHFTDLWFLSIFQNIMHVNGYTVYIMIIKSVVTLLLFIYMMGFAEGFGIKSWIKYLSLSIPFLVVFPWFLNLKSLPWYLSLNFFVVPLINYNGAFFILAYLLMIMSTFIEGLSVFSFLLLALSGLINPLLIGITPLWLLLILAWLIITSKINSINKALLFSSETKVKNVLIGLLISILVTLFAFILTRSPEDNYAQKYSSSIFDVIDVFIRYILGALVYGFPFVIGLYFILRKSLNDSIRNLILISLFLFLSCGIFFAFFLPKIQGDMYQIQRIGWIITIVFLGGIGLLKMLESRTIPYITIPLTVIVCCLSLTNVATERNTAFFPVYFWNHTDGNLKIAVSEVSDLNKLISAVGPNGGYIENNSKARPVQCSIYQYLYFFDSRIKTVRLNIVTNDLINDQSKQLLSQTYLKKVYGSDTTYNQSQILQLIKDYNVTWIISRRNDSLSINNIEAIFPKKITFTYFDIYVKN